MHSEATFYVLGLVIGCAVGVVVVKPIIDNNRDRRSMDVQRAVREALAYDRQMAEFAAQQAAAKEAS